MKPAEPTRTEQGRLIDSIRRNTTLVEGEMAEGDWTEAVLCFKALGKDILELTKMVEAGYASRTTDE